MMIMTKQKMTVMIFRCLKSELTKAVAVVMSVPPAPPATNTVDPFLSKTMVGLMEDIGLFPGMM